MTPRHRGEPALAAAWRLLRQARGGGVDRQAVTCGHCGLICGDFDGGYGTITVDGVSVAVCHPNAGGRPDCQRRVTLLGEEPGILAGVDPKPAGVTGIVGTVSVIRPRRETRW